MKEFLLIDDLIKVLEKDLRERNWIKQHDEVKNIECTQQFYGYSTPLVPVYVWEILEIAPRLISFLNHIRLNYPDKTLAVQIENVLTLIHGKYTKQLYIRPPIPQIQDAAKPSDCEGTGNAIDEALAKFHKERDEQLGEVEPEDKAGYVHE
jgi:hypothetical protein